MSNPDQDKSMLDKAKDMAGGLRDKVGDLFEGNEEKIDDGVDQAGDFVDDKTGGRFGEKTDAVQDAAKGAADPGPERPGAEGAESGEQRESRSG